MGIMAISSSTIRVTPYQGEAMGALVMRSDGNIPPLPPRRRGRAVGIGLSVALGMLPLLAPLHAARAQVRTETSEQIEAQGGTEIQRVLVTYHRTDLATVRRARILLNRLHNAALEACGDDPAIYTEIRRAIERSDCPRESVLRAVRDVNDATLDRAVAYYGLP
jgi:UrcA family protein